MKKHRTRVTKKVFSQTKNLLSIGLKPKQIAQVINLSLSSISRIKSQQSWEAYEALKKEEALSRKEKKIQAVTSSPEEQPKPSSKDKLSMEIHNSQISVLKSIDHSIGQLNETLKELVGVVRVGSGY